MSRVWEGKITSVSKKQCLVFDAFGNVRRADVIASTGTCQTTPSISIDPATNRLNAPVTYDAAGNQTSWNSGAYVYWWYPTGQMRQFDSSGRVTIHGYTADGERVGTYDSYRSQGSPTRCGGWMARCCVSTAKPAACGPGAGLRVPGRCAPRDR